MPRTASTKTSTKSATTAPAISVPSRKSAPSFTDRIKTGAGTVGSTVTPRLKGFSLTPVFVILLIIAAYVIGGLQKEVFYLSEQANKGSQIQAPIGNQPAAVADTAAADVPSGPVPEITDADHIRGNPKAKVMLVEYSDYECPFCQDFHKNMLQGFAGYEKDVAWVYRHYPLDFHPNAQKIAEGSECVAELGGNDKFWQYTDIIFERTNSSTMVFTPDKLGPVAAELGINQAKFQECLDSGKYAQKVTDQMAGGTAAGVNGTPNTFVLVNGQNTKVMPGAVPAASIKADIEAALKQ